MAATWVVTEDLPNQYSSPASGTPVLGHVISFQTGKGNLGSVFIPDTQYEPALIKPAIQVKANLVDEVRALTSSS